MVNVLDKLKKLVPGKPGKPRKEGGQGNHWFVFFGGDKDKLLNMVDDTIKNASSTEKQKVDVLGKDHDLDVYDSSGKIFTRMLVVDKTVYSGFPVGPTTLSLNGTIQGVDEWMNEVEGEVVVNVGSMDGSTALTFFDVEYYKKKQFYNVGDEVTVSLCGLAYYVEKAKEKKFKAKGMGEVSTKTMACLVPASFTSANANSDDYFFQGQVKKMTSFKCYDQQMFELTVGVLRLDGSYENEADLVIYTPKCMCKKFKKGDYVSGNLWLQGTVTLG
ncbi:hypothetical protein ACFLQ2_02705 [archaeon]